MNSTPKPAKRLKIFERRRGFPRLVMGIPAKVTGQDGNIIDAILHDLSPDGAQIRYAVTDGVNLFSSKDGNARKNSNNLKCQLQFKLDLKGEEIPVKIHASSVYLRPVDRKTLASGLFFDPVDREQKKTIRKYLFAQLEDSYANLDELLTSNLTTMPSMKPVLNRAKAEPREQVAQSVPEPVPEPKQNMRDDNDPEAEIEYMKQELLKAQSGLNVIHEAIHNIATRITSLEKKISSDD